MPGAPAGLRGPAPPRAAGWSRAWRSPGSPRCFSPSALVRFFFFFPSCSGFRLPDVSRYPRRRQASGGPWSAPGRTRRASRVCSPHYPAGCPAGSGVCRAAAGAEPRWRRARPCGRAWELRWRRGGWERAAAGRACEQSTQRRRPPLGLAAVGPARTFLASRAAQLPPRRGRPAPASGTARPREAGAQLPATCLSPEPSAQTILLQFAFQSIPQGWILGSYQEDSS
ncbi:uncharacterized protein LOC141568971 [Rhinolophus sinicus]|uniref:uncharacterized protein LOC141568971 n=1 Tax=Rhinolophus sinicus TaxID=89399 RepID=UPI003D7B7C7F